RTTCTYTLSLHDALPILDPDTGIGRFSIGMTGIEPATSCMRATKLRYIPVTTLILAYLIELGKAREVAPKSRYWNNSPQNFYPHTSLAISTIKFNLAHCCSSASLLP